MGYSQEKMLTPQHKSAQNHVVAATTTTHFPNLTCTIASTLAILVLVGHRHVDDMLCLSSLICLKMKTFSFHLYVWLSTHRFLVLCVVILTQQKDCRACNSFSPWAYK